ncbi:hypothetical protein ACSBL2_18360 [Pedobacter sp. AW31-3R]|uniref:hypothetical protein n=1 Tax=Pedobacter sp. AW31-3R TaxID=3445781 RepID=UPI003FA03571
MEKKSNENRDSANTNFINNSIKEEADNPGLDADHSSTASAYAHLNNDNDRISHNPDGESDDSDSDERPGHSPLMDK